MDCTAGAAPDSGENFWQYRRFVSGEAAARVDWRRSARDDHLYVREHEWEACAHGLDLARPFAVDGVCLAAGARTASSIARWSFAFALAEILVEGGERVGIPGLMRPTASRNVIEKMAQAILHDPTERTSLPPTFAPSPLSEIMVLSDFWSPIAEVRRPDRTTFRQRRPRPCRADRRSGGRNASPIRAAIEFVEPEGAGSITAGRAETWRNDYQGRDRAPSRGNPRRDRPARLELHHSPHRSAGERIAAGAACAHGHQRAAHGRRQRGTRRRSQAEQRA